MDKKMSIKKSLLKPAVLLTVVCLFLAAGGTAEAGELLGIHASDVNDLMDTSTILKIDTALGTSVFLADTGLSRSTAPSAANGTSGPNGLAYDSLTGKAYFTSVPNSGGGPPILYSVAVDPPDGMPPMPLGNPIGPDTVVTDAAWFDGKYWYIAAATDDLYSISFDAMGMIETNPLEAELLSMTGETLTFGDITIDQAGILYGDARRNPAGDIVFFTVDLTAPPPPSLHRAPDRPCCDAGLAARLWRPRNALRPNRRPYRATGLVLRKPGTCDAGRARQGSHGLLGWALHRYVVVQ